MPVESGLSLGFASSASNDVYDEPTFRHFLALERARAERSGRPFFLLLVSLRERPGMNRHVWASVSDAVFAGLGDCLRDGDFLGWYRDRRVAGAVLTQGPEVPSQDASGRIVGRVAGVLAAGLPAAVAASLRIRIARSGSTGAP
jgi:hypothetical protein